jgi:transposase
MLEIYADYLLHRWREVKRGHLSHDDFLAEVAQHQADIRLWLEIGTCLAHKTTAGTCRRLLQQWPILWTFTRYHGIEPTNNAAERALRHGVIWRKLCYGTASEAGSRFVERILTMVATARQQGRDLLAFLYTALAVHRQGASVPHADRTHRVRVRHWKVDITRHCQCGGRRSSRRHYATGADVT